MGIAFSSNPCVLSLPSLERRRTKSQNECDTLRAQEIEDLALGFYQAGNHIIRWNTANYASGPYLYRLWQSNHVFTKQIAITK